ncbi:MAG UNVERIFIED_CONTAM: hypothetical protein LVR18_03610 [Planctomycetaceae bacterium]
MNTITSLMTKLQNSCIHPPDINHFKTGSIVADLTAKPQWQYAGHSVHKDQMLKIQWNSLGIESRPRKYMILYRIDPRFTNPQLFIVQYNYITQKYESDFRSFEKGSLLKYQTDPMFDFANRGTKYNNYFNFESSRKSS